MPNLATLCKCLVIIFISMPRYAILHLENHISATFASIFPDSSIAKSFKCEQLVNRIRDAPCYAVSFDECMNKISQNEQMAFIIRHSRTQNTGTPRISEHRQLKNHGNSLKCHGKVMDKSWNYIIRFLWEPCVY